METTQVTKPTSEVKFNDIISMIVTIVERRSTTVEMDRLAEAFNRYKRTRGRSYSHLHSTPMMSNLLTGLEEMIDYHEGMKIRSYE